MTRISYVSSIVALWLLIAWCGSANQESATVDIDTLLAQMAAANLSRDQALARGYGSARIVFVNRNGDAQPASSEQVRDLQSQGVPVESAPEVCGNVMDITWYARNDYLRYDRRIGEYDAEGEGRYGLCEPKGALIICISDDKSIYYNDYEQRAYINAEPIDFFDYTGLMSRFSLHRLYHIAHGVTNSELLNQYDPERISAHEEIFEGNLCIHLQYLAPEKRISPSSHKEYAADYWISPTKGFSVLSYKGHWITLMNGDCVESQTSEYTAEYELASSSSDIWVLKKMYRRDNIVAEQEMWADFTDQTVNFDVPSDMFSFQGMGVPRGVPIFDKRKDGPTEVIEYVDGMYVGLDMIKLNDESANVSGMADHNVPNASNEVDNGADKCLVNSPPDGHESHIALWVALFFLALAVICVFLRKAFAKRCSK